MTTPLRIDGVDLSHHNPVTLEGLKLAKAAGVKFVYHKATEGSTYTDPRFRERRGLCERAGIPFGGYHFARPTDGDAKQEARAFLNVSSFRPGVDLRPMLDLEDRGTMDRNDLSDWVVRPPVLQR
jgi:lysozyme